MSNLQEKTNVVKIERNAPCPCGSGKKYKKCCLPFSDQADKERARLRAEPVPLEAFENELNNLDELSNSIVDLINEGRLEEAELACQDLRRQFPDQIDWIEQKAHIYELRGDNQKAAEWYRKAETFARTQDGFDEECIDEFRQMADQLDHPRKPQVPG
jgi:tetratricopeptide (TPR) repeat protein